MRGNRRRSCRLLARALRRPRRLAVDDLLGIVAIAEAMTGRDAAVIARTARAELASRYASNGATLNGAPVAIIPGVSV